jgi:phosphoribosylanthranilate isomerase
VGTRIKFCGVTDPADARRVAELGAWALGMIFWPSSPRVCAIEEAEAAWQRHGRAFLASYNDPHIVPWALTEFGEP